MRQLLAELRRRHVVRVGLAYLVVAWVLAQAADTILPNLGLPGWTVSLVIVLAIAGFPVTLVLAWALELTPDGVRRTVPLERKRALLPARSHAWHLAVLAFGVAAVGILLARGGRATESSRIDSVAVLAFDDLGAAQDQQHLGAGIAEEILNALANVEGLRVPSRTTTMLLAGQGMLVSELGARLDVRAVLEGSVQRHGDSIRVIAQLIRVSDDSHIWSARFDARAADIFTVQDSIARSVAHVLGARRDAEVAGSMVRAQTGSPEAYDLYLQGRALLGRRTLESLRASAEYFRRAISIDSTYARAYAGLADAYGLSVAYGASPREFPPGEARGFAERALELDDSTGEVYASLGLVNMLLGDWRAAEANWRAATALTPSLGQPYAWRAHLAFMIRGEPETALKLANRAFELEPMAVKPAETYARILAFTGQMEAALSVAEGSVRVNPASADAVASLARIRLAGGDTAGAIEAAETVVALGQLLPEAARVLAAAGSHKEARELLERVNAEGNARDQTRAFLHAALGELDQAFSLLDSAELFPEARGLVEFDPTLAPLRADPRYPALLARYQRLIDGS